MRQVGFSLFALAFALPAQGQNQFRPGDIYVADFGEKACQGPLDQYPGDRIWRVDPDSGAVSLFAALDGPDCGGVTGLVFTPDGTRLRVAQYFNSRILEFDADGNFSVLYDSSDGIVLPLSDKCMTYDAAGNFYVSVWRKILRFAPGSATAEVYASFPTDPLITHSGPLTVDLAGRLYYGSVPGGATPSRILRFQGPNQRSIFVASSPRAAVSLQADTCGQIFAGLDGGLPPNAPPQIVTYDNEDSSSRKVLVEGYDSLNSTPYIAFNPQQSSLYVVIWHPSAVSRLDLSSGVLSTVAEISDKYATLAGIAVVPDQNVDYGFTPCPPPIPTASTWGILVLLLLLLIAAKIRFAAIVWRPAPGMRASRL